MMTLPVWQLENHLAHLRSGGLTARVELQQPAQGLFAVAIGADAEAFNNTRLLGVETPSLASDEALLCDQYVRGCDLAAVYRPSDAWPIRVDVSWRAMVAGQLPMPSTAIDLLISVRTERLDSRPELAAVSVLPADEVLQLVHAEAARFEPLNVASGSPVSIDKQTALGCLLFRLPGAGTSYVEMVHPLDFQRAELAVAEDLAAVYRLRHRLFPLPLEKGVILRTRVRGVFVPRQEDEQWASAAFTAFAAEEPVLGT